MEVKIKNTKNKKQRAVVFGFNHNLNEKNNEKVEESFFNIKTDDGIEITYDGHDSKEIFVIEKISSIDINIKNIEYTSNKNNATSTFYFLDIDANGELFFKPFHIGMYLTPQQESLFPIIIHDEYSYKIEKINCWNSLLFILEPNEEIYLKINEKTVVSQTAKVNR